MIFRLKNFLALFLLLFLLLPFKAEADFYRSLKLGDTGDDVVVLQQILNRDPETKVADSGPGSAGNETSYFGELTRQAVIKLQNKYQAEILTPVGLNVGTGYVGPSTLAQLSKFVIGRPASLPVGEVNPNSISGMNIPPLPPLLELKKTSESNQSNSTYSEANKTANSLAGVSEPKMSTLTKISSISPTSGRPGTRITIKGAGFSKENNDVFAGFNFIKNVKSADGETIVVEVQDPFFDSEYANGLSGRDFSVPVGIYVKNITGVSNYKMFTLEY